MRTNLQEILNIGKTFDPFRDVRKLLGHIIYVHPITFGGLVESGLEMVDHEFVEKKVENNDNSFFIYTNHVKAPKYGDKYIEFDEKTAMMIKHLDWAFCDKIFAGITEAPYNKHLGILKIEEAKFKFSLDKEPGRICNLLFGSAQYVTKKRKWQKIEDRVLDLGGDRDQENAVKLKVYRINERIRKRLGYPELIKFENKTLFVNPDYYYLFKIAPNETE